MSVTLLSERKMAEDATGVVQHGSRLGSFYLSGGRCISPVEVFAYLQLGYSVEVPNAGAGSYREFFTGSGYKKVEVIEHTSSAGDWTFAVKVRDGWLLAGQENRYPYHGYKYWVDVSRYPCASLEELIDCLDR
jgi:hypothetical protein